MLDWSELTPRQRVAWGALAALLVVGVLATLQGKAVSLATALECLAASLFGASLLLNPQMAKVSLRGGASNWLKAVAVEPVPPACKALALAAVALYLIARRVGEI